MATLLSSIRDQARKHLKETTASYWTDAELLDIILKGAHDLWGALIDLNGRHFETVDITNVTLAADTATLTGVPTDVFRITLIEPLDTTPGGANRDVMFRPKPYNSAPFIEARALDAQEPTSGLIIFYDLRNAGSPVAAPTVDIAPQITSAMSLRFCYVPTLSGSLVAGSDNPIPGQSDMALIAWCVAYARAKERQDRSPDPAWLTVYATEKANLLTRSTPRQTQEPEVVEDFFV